MYAYIKGEIADIAEDMLVLECNNIGYNIRVPSSVIQRLPAVGTTIKIYTYTSVREDAFQLFGFLSKDDLDIYQKLITVNSIGPKGALGLMSAMSTDDLRFAIISGDAKTIAKAPGIGKKSAERIILDLRDKIGLQTDSQNSELSVSDIAENMAAKNEVNEAIEAMTALGYSPAEAVKAVRQITITDGMDAGEILKRALKTVMR